MFDFSNSLGWVDYLHAVEAVIPGARGRLLAALAVNEVPQSVRGLARRAGVSPSRASQVLEGLAELGIVERHATGSFLAVRLVVDNVAARWVLELGGLWRSAIDDMRAAGGLICPAPLSLTLFGSFARGTARAGSDVDVVAVRDIDVDDGDLGLAQSWLGTLSVWCDTAGRITGNPVRVIDLGVGELQRNPLGKRLPAWRVAACREGIVLVGSSLLELSGAAGMAAGGR